eukprot:m.489896 g.489896  ORF g.489896 m.489896 type:complete len:75 (-) comp21774_c0_seq10:1464-1688(-)
MPSIRSAGRLAILMCSMWNEARIYLFVHAENSHVECYTRVVGYIFQMGLIPSKEIGFILISFSLMANAFLIAQR